MADFLKGFFCYGAVIDQKMGDVTHADGTVYIQRKYAEFLRDYDERAKQTEFFFLSVYMVEVSGN